MSAPPPEPVYVLKSDMDYIHSLAVLTSKCENFPENEDSLLAATENGFVYLWDLQSYRMKNKQKLGEKIEAVYNLDNGNLITLERTETIKLHLREHSAYVTSTSTTWNGGYCKGYVSNDRLTVPDQKKTISILNADLQKLLTLKLPPDAESFGEILALEPVDATRTLIGHETGDVILYETTLGKTLDRLKLANPITAMSYDAATRRAIIGGPSDLLSVIKISDDFRLRVVAEVEVTSGGCGAVKIRPDGKVVVVGCLDGSVRVLSWKSLKLLAVLKEHSKSVSDVRFAGSRVFVSGGDGVVSVWDLY